MMNGEVEHWAGPAVDGSDEAKQVDLFLEHEHTVIQKTIERDPEGLGDSANASPDIEVQN